MPMLEQELLQEQLDLYRLQRHDFLNHWQVIMGYLQLQNTDKALNYMRKALEGLENEQRAGQIPHSIVQAILLGFVVRLRQEEIPLSFMYPDELKQTSFWNVFWKKEYGQALNGYTKECWQIVSDYLRKNLGRISGKDLRADLILAFEGQGLSCWFELLEGENLVTEKKLELGEA